MSRSILTAITTAAVVSSVSGYSFVNSPSRTHLNPSPKKLNPVSPSNTLSTMNKRSDMSMIEQNFILGGAIALAGTVSGIALVAFTEQAGERAKARGSGLTDDQQTKMMGMLMEDVEVSSVSDLGSLTSQLESALMESGGASAEELEMTEEDKQRLIEEADDGW